MYDSKMEIDPNDQSCSDEIQANKLTAAESYVIRPSCRVEKLQSVIGKVIPHITIWDCEDNEYQGFRINHRYRSLWHREDQIHHNVDLYEASLKDEGLQVRSDRSEAWNCFINSTNLSTKAVARARPGGIRRKDNTIFSRAISDNERASDCISGTKISAQSTQMRRRHAMIRVIAGFPAGTVEGLLSSSMPGMISESLITERPKCKQIRREREKRQVVADALW